MPPHLEELRVTEGSDYHWGHSISRISGEFWELAKEPLGVGEEECLNLEDNH